MSLSAHVGCSSSSRHDPWNEILFAPGGKAEERANDRDYADVTECFGSFTGHQRLLANHG